MMTPISAATAYTNALRSGAGDQKPDMNATGAATAPMSKAAQAFETVMAKTDQAAIGAMSGQTGTHELVQSIAEAELAVNAVVAIRDKVVEAYQEILRMPI